MSRRIFRLLLRTFPSAFRREHGEEMTELFMQRLEQARGWEVLGLWARTAVDMVGNGVALRRGRSVLEGRTRREGTSVRSDTNGRRETMGEMMQDLRYALRRLAKSPVFTLSAVAIAAVGIGANATVFAVVDTLLFRPPPYERPEEVVTIYQDSDDGEPSSSSFPAYEDMRDFDQVFADVAASTPGQLTWDREGRLQTVSVEWATSSYLPVFGLEVSRGRWFQPEHDEVGAGYYAVVSHRTWQSELGGDPSAVGRTVRLNGQPVTVLGVAPAGFHGLAAGFATDFFLSISSVGVGGSFRIANLERRQDHWYDVKARLAPGVDKARAQAAMDALAGRLAEEYPELNRGRGISVFGIDDVRIHPRVDGQLAGAGTVLGAVALLILVLACSNLANLLIVRGTTRSSEMAVRRALGASRGGVARLLLFEALLLAFAGGVVGLALAAWAAGAIAGLGGFLPVPGTPSFAVDGRVLVFGLALMVVTGTVFGFAPALRSARADVARILNEQSRSASPGRGARLFRNGLVALQVAVSATLVVGAGLLARSVAEMQQVDPGVDADRVAYVRTDLAQAGLAGDELTETLRQLLRRAEGLPGVSAAALTHRLPVEPGGTTTRVVEGYEPPSGTGSVELTYVIVSDGYFETMGIPVLEGRSFLPTDDGDAPPVMVVNETAARRFWPAGGALGRRIRPQSTADGWSQVVGVVGDTKVGSLAEPPTPTIYFPMARAAVSSPYIVVRTQQEPGEMVAPLRRAVRELRSTLPVEAQGTLEGFIGQSLAGRVLGLRLLGGFSLLALILAALGIYAVTAYSVSRRTAEMGIRVALGAHRGRVIRLVVGEVAGTVLVGLGVGAALAYAGARSLDGVLFQVGAADPTAFMGAFLLLALAAGVAALVPAWRAARADPVEAFRVQ